MADFICRKKIVRKTVFLFRFPCPVYYIKKHIREKGRCIQLRISYVGKTGCWFGFAHFNSFLTIILRISHAKWAILCTGFQRKTSYQFLCMFFIYRNNPRIKPKIFFLLIICCSPTNLLCSSLELFYLLCLWSLIRPGFFLFFYMNLRYKSFSFPTERENLRNIPYIQHQRLN